MKQFRYTLSALLIVTTALTAQTSFKEKKVNDLLSKMTIDEKLG